MPYRDSKLTKLLMDSLGGSSMTLMIACVAPGSEFVEESLSTLQYATRAANIKNDPIVKMDPTERLIAQLRHEVRQTICRAPGVAASPPPSGVRLHLNGPQLT